MHRSSPQPARKPAYSGYSLHEAYRDQPTRIALTRRIPECPNTFGGSPASDSYLGNRGRALMLLDASGDGEDDKTPRDGRQRCCRYHAAPFQEAIADAPRPDTHPNKRNCRRNQQ